MEQVSLGAANPVDLLCHAHPDRAEELRARMRRLQALGLLDGHADPAPRRVGPFTIVGLLGQGGMGEVYLAQQAQPVRRMAALKIVRGGVATHTLLRRFEAERQALATLNHPGIAQVLEAGADEQGQPWFAMEYVDGPPLTDYCDEHALGLDARIELFLQVCDAVSHAHQNGILHRDLKPGNVLVTERLDKPLVKVIDFGLAKATEASPLDASLLTQTGQLLGTPAYMSPEQAGALPGSIDPRTDVYALGVMLYQLLVGRLPLAPRDSDVHPMLQMQKLLRDAEPVRPSLRVAKQTEEQAACRQESVGSWARALSGDLDWIVARAMARHKDERYPAVSELAADLRRHLRSEVVLAGPPSTAHRVARYLRRHKREAIAAGLGLAALVIASIVYVFRLSGELRRFDVLEREIRLAELVRQADEDLWPATPAVLPAMAAWSTEVQAILDQEDEFRDTLDDVRTAGALEHGGYRFDQPRDTALHASVVRLLDGLAVLASEQGLLADVQARMAWAAGLERASLIEPSAAWEQAIASIADPQRCPAYAGLVIEPQLGLLPLGRNDATGLWEFACLQPGARLPVWRDDRWAIESESCPVLVLIPPGVVRQGTQSDSPLAPNYFPVPTTAESDGPVVELDAFFLSRYELSQAQYERITGERPSRSADDAHPVEQLSWEDAQRAVQRMGLGLPTGAQWEYAARSGSPDPWWTGSADEPPDGCGNLADLRYILVAGTEADVSEYEERYDDGYAGHAPVDAFAPNAFGLHNVIGNVWEWCLDPGLRYGEATRRAGDGLQQPLPGVEPRGRSRELRGGSFKSSYRKSRSTYRFFQSQTSSNVVFGVRPARPVVSARAGSPP